VVFETEIRRSKSVYQPDATLAQRMGEGLGVRVPGESHLKTMPQDNCQKMTLKWIAQRLHMGTWTHVSNCLGSAEKQKCQKMRTDTFMPDYSYTWS
jgi:hypothetical protein